VKGDAQNPLFAYLTSRSNFEGPVTWNFNKFLISRSGKLTARFGAPVDPLSPAIIEQIEALFTEPFEVTQ